MIDYLRLNKNDFSRIIRENVNLQPFTDGEHYLKMVKASNDVIYDVRTNLHKLTYVLKDLIEQTKSEINLYHNLNWIITATKTVKATEEMNMELNKEEPMSTKHMDEVINKIVHEKVQKKVKESTKIMAKKPFGWRKGLLLRAPPPQMGHPRTAPKNLKINRTRKNKRGNREHYCFFFHLSHHNTYFITSGHRPSSALCDDNCCYDYTCGFTEFVPGTHSSRRQITLRENMFSWICVDTTE